MKNLMKKNTLFMTYFEISYEVLLHPIVYYMETCDSKMTVP